MSEQTRPVALVTGAGRGIGAVIARDLGLRGYAIALHYWDNEDGAKALATEIQTQGSPVELIKADLALDGTPYFVVDEAARLFGKVDLLVNNAGITRTEPFLQVTPDSVGYTYRVNFLAPYLCAQRCAALMIAQSIPGAIVHITSVHQERVTDKDSVYGAMKAALARVTESMAYELGPHGIRVNAIAPGRIRLSTSPLTPVDEAINQVLPLQRSGTPQDVADAVAWLASPASSYVTGTTIRVDGGMNLPMQRTLIGDTLRFF